MITERSRPWIALAAGCVLLAAIAAGLLVADLAAEEDPDRRTRALSVERVLEDPEQFAGQEIAVAGRVDVLTDRALSLGEQDLIVIARGREARLQRSGFAVGDAVRATGELRVLSADEAVELIPGVSLLPTQFQEFERQAVLLADRVVPGR